MGIATKPTLLAKVHHALNGEAQGQFSPGQMNRFHQGDVFGAFSDFNGQGTNRQTNLAAARNGEKSIASAKIFTAYILIRADWKIDNPAKWGVIMTPGILKTNAHGSWLAGGMVIDADVYILERSTHE